MDRRQLVGLTAILIVVGVAGAAATIDTATWDTGAPSVPSEPSGGGASGPPGSSMLVALYLAVVVFTVLAVAFAIRSGLLGPRQLAVIVTLLGVSGVIVYFLLSITGTKVIPPELLEALERLGFGDRPNATDGTLAGNGTSGAGSGASGGDGGLLSLGLAGALLGIVGLAVVGIGRLLRRDSRSTRGSSSGEEAAAVGRAAGRAADRLEDAAVENPIYRAWHEMVTALGVTSPETTTPAAFAEAAVEAGLDPDDIAALTDLFRAVRYGTTPVTDERIDRARETLRRIEASYADDTDDDGGDGE